MNKVSWRITEESMSVLSAPCSVLNNNPDSAFRSNDIVDEVVEVAKKLKLFEGSEGIYLDNKVLIF